MKRWNAVLVAVVLSLACLAPSFAGDAGEREINLKGWVTDSCCGAKNANEKGKDCTLACVKNGSKVMLYAGGKNYKVSDEKLALQHVGYEVEVTGTLDAEGVLKIGTIKKAGPKA